MKKRAKVAYTALARFLCGIHLTVTKERLEDVIRKVAMDERSMSIRTFNELSLLFAKWSHVFQ